MANLYATAQKFYGGRPWHQFQVIQWGMSDLFALLFLWSNAKHRVRADAVLVVIAIYVDSWMFVFATAIIQFGFGVDYSFPVCDSAILLCLVCYVSSKVCWQYTPGNGDAFNVTR